MSNHIYNHRDTNLNLYQVNSNYILLLQIYPTTFSYIVVYKNKLMAWAEDCELELLADPGEEHELLNYDYKNVVVGLHSTGFNLVPSALFNEDKIADFARYLDVMPNEKVFAQPLDNENHIVFKVDSKVASAADIYGIENTVFINQGWVSAIGKTSLPNNQLYLNIDKTQVDILYFLNDKIRFYNRFSFTNPDELAYYTTLVAQELKLDPGKLILSLSGNCIEDDNNLSRLANFFNGVELNELPLLTLPSMVLPHLLLSLSALALCVSSEVL